jgi:hypothetical protein
VDNPVDNLGVFPQGINTYQNFSTRRVVFSTEKATFSTEKAGFSTSLSVVDMDIHKTLCEIVQKIIN